MKDDWERPPQQYELTAHNAEAIAESAIPGHRVVSFERLGNGFSNSNYRVILEDIPSPLIFRLYNGKRGIASKEQNLSRLVGCTVPVAAYLHVDESCKQVEVPFAILEWKKGVLLSDLMKKGQRYCKTSVAEAVGKTLAKIHEHKFSKYGLLNEQLRIEEPFRIDEEKFLSLMSYFTGNHCGAFLGERVSDEVMKFCKLHGHNLSGDRETPVLVHSDYNGLNILIERDNGEDLVSAVLDWEYAFSGSMYADIGNMLRYEKEGSEFETFFLKGYEDGGGVLGENWRILSKLHDLVALCDLLERSTSEMQKRVLNLRKLISSTVR